MKLPDLVEVRQAFPRERVEDVDRAVREQLGRHAGRDRRLDTFAAPAGFSTCASAGDFAVCGGSWTRAVAWPLE